jgi:uncharacterized membrane protein YebE (DUF533 family)
MATTPLLGRDVYLALAAVGWADGKLSDQAADAILGAAAEEGLDLDDLERIRAAVQAPVDLGRVDRANMSKSDRLYVYAVASFIASLDGEVSAERRERLAALGTLLAVPEQPRNRADAIMRELTTGADGSAQLDLRALRRTLDDKLEAARRARQSDR